MQHLEENEGIEGFTFAVTGGLGFVGAALCLDLVRRGARLVRAFDLRTTSPWLDDLNNNGVHCFQGDLTCQKEVEQALRGMDCVFHLASYGISGKEMIQSVRCDSVNIKGKNYVLEACIQNGIKRLVYVSTPNVVFGGKEIVDGNESLPYIPKEGHMDPYSRSKCIAEQSVLNSNRRPLKKNGKLLYTCAVRPGTIYGPGEERHLPRMINLAKLGLILFRIGDINVKQDWVYVDNLVLALILASKGLSDDIPGREKHPIAAGQSYFISDDVPVNSFQFLSLLLKSLEYDMPKASLTVPQAVSVGKAFRVLYTLMYPWLSRPWLPQPFILPSEVYKVGVTHYFSISKAREELGYRPLVSPQEGMAATISHWQESKRRSLDGPTIYTWVLVIGGMIALFAAAFLPAIGPVTPLRAFSLSLLGSMWSLKALFIASSAAHIGEAIYAWRLAKRVDPVNSRGWLWQTFALGIFSLRFLLKRAHK